MSDAAVARLRSVALLTCCALLVGAAAPVPKPKVITVIARDFAFELPASIPAGVTTFRLVNKGKQMHHLSVFRLDSGKTAAEGLKALMDAGHGPRPAWLLPVGGPQTIMPGTEGVASLALDAGSYLAFCEVPGPTPVPHFMKGMAKGFTVTGTPSAATMPMADDTLALSDYTFAFSHPITKGRHVIAVTNNGPQAHMVVIVRLDKRTTFAQWLEWANDPKGKRPPATASGGATEMVAGNSVTFVQNFRPGHYGMICFTGDAKDGKPHFMHGMQQEFAVQ